MSKARDERERLFRYAQAIGEASRTDRCETCQHPLEPDGTCVYAQFDQTEGVDHATGEELNTE